MTDIIEEYFDVLIARLGRVRDTQAENIRAAAKLCARSIARDKLVFTFGTGHGALPAIETFPRTGTVAGFRPIVESSMISFHHVLGDQGARQYRFIHAVEGYGKAILSAHHLDAEDTLILFSHSGINAVILDMALQAKALGMKVIAVTSLPHSSTTASRHSSGQRLFEVADVVIDTGVPKADASLKIAGLEAPVGASSTSITIAIAHAIVSATAQELVAQGITPRVMINPNTEHKEAANRHNDENYADMWRRLRAR
ncbi:SIS domain-containing protein [Gluconacetobacter entanii]|jgi:uncharacterized phosphosugar-binding protein|uniref:SIS domain-containing protein n=2 Tax=Acetobacteraceae TaxID=433 RepID=A0A2S3W3X6_9PROT|nr:MULTISPECIES: SIS domain-containing protein [Acetobacteraceae]MBE7620962.1 sugar isomerase domain-containing protein [Komagataeibacter sp. FXV2]MCE2578652.1 SIS domain-containing protein [Komagataeibacter sp. FNDCR1]MCW4590877.1 SIS domain-containing protein [Gluconacetobacter entanii]MCW4593049.1 SIS domain-containing protein [Gluconacetobacter entanii]NPC90203.1 SIS domain-containing protein [Gluconacetobacter entanii]